MKLVVKHLIAFWLALFISWIILFALKMQKRMPKMFCQEKFSGLYLNYASGEQAEADVAFNLMNNQDILLIGSSELTGKDTLRRKPFHFISDHSQSNVLGMGHAGNQSFAILTQLMNYRSLLKDAKLVVVVSPGWFTNGYENGTSLTSFLEYSNERFLLNIYHDTALSATYKDALAQYIERNYNEISSPSWVMKAFYYNASTFNKVRYAPLVPINDALLSTRKSDIKPTPLSRECEHAKKTPITDTIEWNTEYSSALANHKKNSSNNTWGIVNDYYSNYTKGQQAEQKLSSITNNQELTDFKLLCKYLKEVNCDPYFIIQPLNSYAYKGLEDVNPIIDSIKNISKRNNIPYSNMFTSDTATYVKGTLSDVMHLGDYGWMKINRKIINHYNIPVNEK